MKKAITFFTAIIVFVFQLVSVSGIDHISAYDNSETENIINGIINYSRQINGASGSLLNSGLTGKAGSPEGDWYAIALSRYGAADGSDQYLQALRNYTESSYQSGHGLSAVKATEWHRIIMAVLSCGGDAYSFDAGQSGRLNLVSDGIYNRGNTASLGKQGITGWIWGLIALDSMHYQIPDNAFYSRQDIINEILSRQLDDGGFTLAGNMCDVDITASAVTALAPYYDTDENIRGAVDNALQVLSSRQLEQGDFESGGIPNAESTAQVIMALTSLGIDVFSDGRFIKNGNTVPDGLMAYWCENGGFAHQSGSDANEMSCVQSLMAFVSLYRYSTSQSRFYDFGTYEYTGTNDHENNNASDVDQNNNQTADKENAVNTSQLVSGTQAQVNTNIVTSSFPAVSHAVTKKYISDTNTLSQSQSDHTSEPDKQGGKTVMSEDGAGRSGIRIIIVISAALAAALTFVIFKKKTKLRNNILFAVGIIASVLLVLTFMRIKSAKNYYTSSDAGGEVCGKVTLSIDCMTLSDKYETLDDPLIKYVPSDGYILKSAEYDISKGDTVYDVLLKAVKENKLEFSFEGSSQNSLGTVYVQSIGNLGEFDFGELSGWIYTVDGQQKSAGCDDLEVSDGDVIRWSYTCDLGRDIR